MPLYHVRARFPLPVPPQFPYQEPPRPQQLILPDFLMMPQSRHTGPPMDVVVTAGCGIWKLVKHTKSKTQENSLSSVSKHASTDVNLGLTSTGLHALKPAVTEVVVACTSTILIPSTARSATADSSGFLERAAVWTHGNSWRSERRGYHSPSC